jgi:hypothetical protein
MPNSRMNLKGHEVILTRTINPRLDIIIQRVSKFSRLCILTEGLNFKLVMVMVLEMSMICYFGVLKKFDVGFCRIGLN